MEAEFIAIIDYCSTSSVEAEFIRLLKEEGLIEIYFVSEQEHIAIEQLPLLEQYARWYYEMEINLGGIDALQHMLYKVKRLQAEVDALQNKLRLYEQS